MTSRQTTFDNRTRIEKAKHRGMCYDCNKMGRHIGGYLRIVSSEGIRYYCKDHAKESWIDAVEE